MPNTRGAGEKENKNSTRLESSCWSIWRRRYGGRFLAQIYHSSRLLCRRAVLTHTQLLANCSWGVATLARPMGRSPSHSRTRTRSDLCQWKSGVRRGVVLRPSRTQISLPRGASTNAGRPRGEQSRLQIWLWLPWFLRRRLFFVRTSASTMNRFPGTSSCGCSP